jgi:hypothetical protein
MDDIFISYANEDRDRAAQLAAFLEAEGWRVWWDRRIPAGRTWRSVLEEAVEDTRCMIVLWSENSVKSPWVAEEAEEARRLGKTLVPVMIQRVEPPMGFRTIQAANLINWDGSAHHPDGRQLVADLKSLLTPHDEKAVTPIRDVEPQPPPSRTIPRWMSLHWPKAALGALAILAIFAVWNNWLSFKDSSVVPAAPEKQPSQAAAPRLTNLSLSADRKMIKTSETLKLSVRGRYSDGSQSDISDGVEWVSTDMRVATVDERGEVTALQTGTTNIIAKIGDVESSEWNLGVESAKPVPKPVVAPKLVALNVSSSKQELVESERIALRAKGRYSDNSEKYLSSGIEWQISDTTVASLDDRGELVARRPGKIRIVARSDDLTSSPLTLLIKETPKKPEEPRTKPLRAAESQPPQPVKSPAVTEQVKARISAHIDRAQSFREQGNYAAALAELEKAKALDAASEEIRKEIEQTKRACNAEKVLGNKPNC